MKEPPLAHRWLGRVAVLGATASLLVVLALLIKLNPFYGMMDDASLIKLGHQAEARGLWSAWLAYVRDDIQWGMIRPFYPWMAFLLYGEGGRSPLTAFTLNFFFVTGTLVFYGVCWRKILAGALPVPGALSSRGFVGVFLVGALAFPWTHSLFLFPSLQEKLVLLAGAASLVFFSSDTRSWSAWKFGIVSTLVLVAGFLTKAQFAMYAPACVLLALAERPERRVAAGRAVFVALVAIAISLALREVARRGAYVGDHYSLRNVLPNLLGASALFLLAFATGYGVFLLTRERRPALRAFLPIAVVLGYLGVFLPWGIINYLLSSIGVVLAVAMAVCVDLLSHRVLRTAVVIALAVVAVGMSGYRAYVFFGHLADLREIVYSAEIEKIALTGKPVYMGCAEGSGAFRDYLKQFRGLNVTVLAITELPASGNGFYLGDSKLCPLPGVLDHVVKEARYPGGFAIYE